MNNKIVELRRWIIKEKRKNAECLYASNDEVTEGVYLSDEELDDLEVRLALYELIIEIRKRRGF